MTFTKYVLDKTNKELSTLENKEIYKQLLNYVKDGSLTEYALRRAKRYQIAAQESINPFKGFEDGKIYSSDELREALRR